MAGIAGIEKENASARVSGMLDRIAHRGLRRRKIIETEGITMGVCWNDARSEPFSDKDEKNFVCDIAGPGHFATAVAHNGTFVFSRDELGVAPLYTGSCTDGAGGFASEVKALNPEMSEIEEVMPGEGGETINPVTSMPSLHRKELTGSTDMLVSELKRLLNEAVSLSIRTEDTGSWLSGGLDSAAITALASQHLAGMKTFTAGLDGAPDLEYASVVARFLGTEHHEIIVTADDLMRMLPDVIWHLESFDPLLVRSSLLNFAAAQKAADHVSDIFSGEGADELFAGYSYLSCLPEEKLHHELLRLTGKLHNTALQRVDRCASAFGMTARVVFTCPGVKEFALAVAPSYKICEGIGKWILRKAVEDILPAEITWRQKAKFWEGGGVNEKLSEIADISISDSDFRRERVLSNGWTLSGKEELSYYRIFREHFGSDISLTWIGRTDNGTVA